MTKKTAPQNFLILSTAASLQQARRLAALLLTRKLAACINILPGLESHYRWKGKKEKAGEVLLLIKSRASVFARLEKTLRENHSYAVPEIIALPIQKGSPKYLKWIQQEVKR